MCAIPSVLHSCVLLTSSFLAYYDHLLSLVQRHPCIAGVIPSRPFQAVPGRSITLPVAESSTTPPNLTTQLLLSGSPSYRRSRVVRSMGYGE